MVDVSPEQKGHRRGPTDPTGAVSSGLQPGPLRGREELAPVAEDGLEEEAE